jgi:hypothetical protein
VEPEGSYHSVNTEFSSHSEESYWGWRAGDVGPLMIKTCTFYGRLVADPGTLIPKNPHRYLINSRADGCSWSLELEAVELRIPRWISGSRNLYLVNLNERSLASPILLPYLLFQSLNIVFAVVYSRLD